MAVYRGSEGVKAQLSAVAEAVTDASPCFLKGRLARRRCCVVSLEHSLHCLSQCGDSCRVSEQLTGERKSSRWSRHLGHAVRSGDRVVVAHFFDWLVPLVIVHGLGVGVQVGNLGKRLRPL